VLILASSNVLHWASLAAFFAGGCGTLAINLDNALLQGLTPVVMQGRLSSIANLTKGLQAFSASGASWLIHVLSHSPNATTSGYLEVQLSLALLLVAGVVLLWPTLRRLQTVPA
jgi:ABC-type nickel/cobalt efflux system permease component RcnA